MFMKRFIVLIDSFREDVLLIEAINYVKNKSGIKLFAKVQKKYELY